MNELYFSFGAFDEPISKQYKEQGYVLKNAEKWDKALDSIIFLHIHNLLTDSRYDECLNRLIKETKKDIVTEQPTYDIDEVVEMLEEISNNYVRYAPPLNDYESGFENGAEVGINKAIEIIKGVSE